MGVELFQADGRTDKKNDKKELIVAFCNFSNEFKRVFFCVFLLNKHKHPLQKEDVTI